MQRQITLADFMDELAESTGLRWVVKQTFKHRPQGNGVTVLKYRVTAGEFEARLVAHGEVLQRIEWVNKPPVLTRTA